MGVDATYHYHPGISKNPHPITKQFSHCHTYFPLCCTGLLLFVIELMSVLYIWDILKGVPEEGRGRTVDSVPLKQKSKVYEGS